MTVSLLPPAAPDSWFNVAHWQEVQGGFIPWRIKPDLVATARNPHFTNRVMAPAGVRVEVVTDAARLNFALTPVAAGNEAPLIADVLFDDELLARVPLNRSESGTPTTSASVDLPGRVGRLALWLPQASGVVLNEVSLIGGSVVRAVPARAKWVTYGSSITHCIEAEGPSETWPALVSRQLGLDLYGLGLAAQCHLDYAVERAIANIDADYISLCLGINIYGRGSFDERSLPGAVHGFIARVLQAHPGVPLAVISPLTSPPAETRENHVGLTLQNIRSIVSEVATDFANQGVGFIPGPEIIAASDVATQLRDDELHPHADGYRFMAQRLAPRLAEIFDISPDINNSKES